MSIRFTCSSCRTVLKLGEMIAEPKKVRCTGCSIVILVEPDPADPTGLKTSIPAQSLNKEKSRSDKQLARQRKVLLVLGGIILVGAVIALWWNFRPPNDRGSIAGAVKLDGEPVERGMITFISEDGQNVRTSGLINQGQYKISAYNGPMVGINKVEIRSEKKTGRSIAKPGSTTGEQIDEVVEGVAERYNTKSREKLEIKAGANTKDYEIKSK